MKITLDPGHGRRANASAVREGFYEGTNNYEMALRLKSELESFGAEVVLTRESIDSDPSLAERGSLAAENGSELFYSIHSNAFSDPTAYGVTGFYSVNTPGVKPLCEAVCAKTAELIGGSKVRRVITKTLDDGRDYYGVLRASEGVKYSMLVEHGFYTNPAELERIADSAWQSEWARETAKVIADFFGLAKIPEKPAPAEESTKEKLLRISEELKEIAETL